MKQSEKIRGRQGRGEGKKGESEFSESAIIYIYVDVDLDVLNKHIIYDFYGKAMVPNIKASTSCFLHYLLLICCNMCTPLAFRPLVKT